MKRFLRPTKRTLALFAVTIGSSIAILDASIVNLALPAVAKDLTASFSVQQWIADAYLLSLSALILLGGSLGDIFGRKRAYLVGVAGFGISSVVCALAPNAEMLIAARVLQGMFGALMVPGALAIINTNFPKDERGRAIGHWTAWSSIAVVAAPFLAGSILATGGWRWIFLVNIPLSAVCFAMTLRAARESSDQRVRRIDGIGAALVTVALGGLTYGLIEGPVQAWSMVTIGSLIVGLLALVAFVLWEKRSRDPMIRLSLFRSRAFSGANLMTFLMYGALGGFSFILAIHLQSALHYTAFQAGMSLLPISLCLLLFSGWVGSLSAKYGPRFFMTAGPMIAAAGIALLYSIQPDTQYVIGVLPGILLFSIGLSLLVSPLTTTVMLSVDESASGIASGVNNAVARAAGLIVIAVLGLFGANEAYPFAIVLCAALAALGGIISFLTIPKAIKPHAPPRQ
ncbi:DHA2 family efflux MFS transporter permease subunit [Streptomyces caniscabiei]|uniref:DHA2 family efflux MFS transporter permease subunit n=1 Tax=Streptomyces caniscabiei TaxID=2746961 RepID=UPI0029AC63D0|nr:DHA2 family efflux MFS transporter permease subunit [Streptomyces caniscabiei]MDX2776082.1 DHA2 family efflux MFS transporter permease subunit [Streptomyces caniscabiei]